LDANSDGLTSVRRRNAPAAAIRRFASVVVSARVPHRFCQRLQHDAVQNIDSVPAAHKLRPAARHNCTGRYPAALLMHVGCQRATDPTGLGHAVRWAARLARANRARRGSSIFTHLVRRSPAAASSAGCRVRHSTHSSRRSMARKCPNRKSCSSTWVGPAAETFSIFQICNRHRNASYRGIRSIEGADGPLGT